MLVTFEVFQLPISLLKIASLNIEFISSTLEVSQPPISSLNFIASINMLSILVTFETFQFPILKLSPKTLPFSIFPVPANIPDIDVTFETSHEDKSASKFLAPLNILSI